jgi:hypothetical protein
MDEHLVSKLKNYLAAGMLVLWWSNGKAEPVIKIGVSPPGDPEETGPCGYLGNGLYIALDTVDPVDITVHTQNLWGTHHEIPKQLRNAGG